MPKNEKSSAELASLASKILSGEYMPDLKDIRALAGSVLTQAPDREDDRDFISAYGILNREGEPWTTKVFRTEKKAEQYLKEFWQNIITAPDLRQFKIVMVKILFPKKNVAS